MSRENMLTGLMAAVVYVVWDWLDGTWTAASPIYAGLTFVMCLGLCWLADRLLGGPRKRK